MLNKQRNLSYNPQVAKAQRIAQKAQENAERRAEVQRQEAARKQEVAEARRAHGRMLDQVEHCYRQYAPAQIHQAQAMRECNPVDAAFDAGEVEWRDDCLAIVGS